MLCTNYWEIVCTCTFRCLTKNNHVLKYRMFKLQGRHTGALTINLKWYLQIRGYCNYELANWNVVNLEPCQWFELLSNKGLVFEKTTNQAVLINSRNACFKVDSWVIQVQRVGECLHSFLWNQKARKQQFFEVNNLGIFSTHIILADIVFGTYLTMACPFARRS